MESYWQLYLVLGFLTLSYPLSSSQTITIDEETKTVEGGNNVGVFCYVDSSMPGANYQLQFYFPNGTQLGDNMFAARAYVTRTPDQRIKLNIDRAKTEDSGVYRCKGDVNGQEQEDTVEIKVKVPIIVDNIPTTQKFTQGTDAKVLCSASAPNIVIYWYDNNQQKVEADNTRMQQESDGLLIRNVVTSDEGRYLCRLESLTGDYKHVYINVIVNIKPTITQQPSLTEGKVGDRLQLSCRADGKPSPLYSWWKSRREEDVKNELRGDRYEFLENGDMFIKELVEDDEGWYECRATNEAGQAMSSAKVDVLIPPKIERLDNVSSSEGGVADIRCEVTGDPLPTVSWRKDGSGVIITDQAPEVDNDQTGQQKSSVSSSDDADGRKRTSTLHITDLEPKDTGRYECIAEASKAGSTSGFATLIVQYKPLFDDSQPNQQVGWANMPGGARLSCMTTAVPIADKVEWLMDGNPINDGAYKQQMTETGPYQKTNTLVISIDFTNMDTVYRTYTCRASNSMGTSDLNVTLVKADPPKVIVSELTTTPTSTEMRVIVTHGQGPQPETIVALYVEGGETKKKEYSLNGRTETTVEINDLRPEQNYVINFYATSEIGDGPYESRSITTPQTRVPYKPVITSKLEGDYSIKYNLEWAPPKDGGAPITEYHIEYRQVKVKPLKDPVTNEYVFLDYLSGPESYDTKTAATTYLLQNLRPSTYYQVTVQAKNLQGLSEKSEAFIFRTNNIPSSGYVDASANFLSASCLVVNALAILSACQQYLF